MPLIFSVIETEQFVLCWGVSQQVGVFVCGMSRPKDPNDDEIIQYGFTLAEKYAFK